MYLLSSVVTIKLVPALFIYLFNNLIQLVLILFTPVQLCTFYVFGKIFTFLVMLVFLGIWGVNGLASDWPRYIHIFCRSMPPRAAIMWPDYYVEWYCHFCYSVLGRHSAVCLFLEFLAAQLPDRIKGLGIGLMLACSGTVHDMHVYLILQCSFPFTL